MELFTVNRYNEEEHGEISKSEEQSKLDKVLQRIEKNRKLRNKRKVKGKTKQEIIAKTTLERQRKREKKAQYVAVPEDTNKDFIDPDLVPNVDQNSIEEKLESTIIDPSPKKKKKNKNSGGTIEGFTVLRTDNFDKKGKVTRILPKWLLHPTIISTNLRKLQTKVSEIELLDKSLRKKLKVNGIKKFFPVQAEVIPWLLKENSLSDIIFPRDICVSAPTGSGKTLAFALPILQALKKHTVKKIRALVILPTQDLALQVFRTFKLYSEGTSIHVGCITGDNPFVNEQKALVSENPAFGFLSKVDILVCTAGRLIDHLKHTRGFNLHELEFLVIDEADRVLDNVQNDWLYHLEKHILQEEMNASTGRILNLFTLQKKRPPQKLLFSATLSQDPEKLQKLSLFQPKLFTSIMTENDETVDQNNVMDTFVGKYTTPKELSEKYIISSSELKPLVLYKLIERDNLKKTIVFTNSLSSVHRLAVLLKSLFGDQLNIQEISSSQQIKNRKKLISEFDKGTIDLLICTDAMARGIDLPAVQCVISYSAPKHLKTYIHRAGRTARAGEEGTAITILQDSQVTTFKSLLNQANKNNVQEISIPEEHLESLSTKYETALVQLKKTIHKEEREDAKKKILSKHSVRTKRK